jgi:hypothetical protein
MRAISQMSLAELAGFICQAMENADVTVTLTGGACVAIYSRGKYVSDDLDFIEEGPVPRQKVRQVMASLGFTERGRHFVHPNTKFLIEFPNGPLMVGDQRIVEVRKRRTPSGVLRLLSPTDCVKDRLAAFFHWKDRQSLQQALMVARAQPIDLRDIRKWSKSEGMETRFREFEQHIKSRRPPKKRTL